MKLIVNAFFTLLAFFALAQSASAESPPLMTIRFNQKNISYQSRLNEVIHQAIAIKPSANFEVVNVTASGQGAHGQEVATAITQSGVPASQVTVSSENSNVNSEEVRIFVR